MVLLSFGISQAVAEDILATLRAGHPRLILLDEDLPRIRKAIAANPQAAIYYKQFQHDAPAMTTQPVIQIRDAQGNAVDTLLTVTAATTNLGGTTVVASTCSTSVGP